MKHSTRLYRLFSLNASKSEVLGTHCGKRQSGLANVKGLFKHLIMAFLLLLVGVVIHAQDMPDSTQSKKKAKKIVMRDTLDGKFDFSSFLVDAHGFLPIPVFITDPAFGGFGMALVPTFISPKKNVPAGAGYTPPDITAAMGMYTVNKSWGVGGIHSGSIPKAGIKYRVGAFYGDINMSFYREIFNQGEKEFEFGLKSLPVILSVSKKITASNLYAGVQYNFMQVKLSPHFGGNLPEFIRPKETDSHTATLGLFLDWDRRNTVFTPDKGFHANVLFSMNDNWTGSDFEYQKLGETFTWFTPIKPNWISGIRLEGHQAFNNPPFYLQPAIDMRGIPSGRFQGKSTYVLETEQRFDINLRWSVLGFGGWGTAIEKDQSFGSGKNVYNAGAGFRYLLARVFKLRAGIDVAKGPDSWGWYIVFGHNWNR